MNLLPFLVTLAAQADPGAQIDAQLAALDARLALLESAEPGTTSTAVAGVYDASRWIPDGGDLADAVDRIQRSPDCDGHPNGTTYEVGCRIQIPSGVWQVSRTVHVCRQLVLEGTGRTSTRLEFGQNSGIVVAPSELCESLGYQTGQVGGARPSGQGSTIRDMRIRGVGTVWPAPLYYTRGVALYRTAHLENVEITDFTQGLQVIAEVGAATSTSAVWPTYMTSNANGWSVDRVRVFNTRHAGVYIDGADANAGSARLLDVTSACQDADQYTNLRPCAGVDESSFLGNNYDSIHVATVFDRRGGQYPGIYTDSGNASNTFMNPYVEGPMVNLASNKDVIIGGAAIWVRGAVGDPMVIRDSLISGFCSVDPNHPARQRVCVGDKAGSGALAVLTDTVAPYSGQYALRLKAAVQEGEAIWRWDVANSAVVSTIDIEGRTRYHRRLTPPQCTAPGDSTLDGLAVDVGPTLGICRMTPN